MGRETGAWVRRDGRHRGTSRARPAVIRPVAPKPGRPGQDRMKDRAEPGPGVRGREHGQHHETDDADAGSLSVPANAPAMAAVATPADVRRLYARRTPESRTPSRSAVCSRPYRLVLVASQHRRTAAHQPVRRERLVVAQRVVPDGEQLHPREQTVDRLCPVEIRSNTREPPRRRLAGPAGARRRRRTRAAATSC
jgi:hypothetical protein